MWPYRLPRRRGRDGVIQSREGIVGRLLHVEGAPIVANAWQHRDGPVVLRATQAGDGASDDQLALAIDRMRFALGLDDDFSEFYDRFRGDPLLGPAIRRNPSLRPRRRPWPWEALAWAVTEQLIESPRAAAIQRRIVRRWGPTAPSNLPGREDVLRDVPSAATIMRVAPAELASMDLAPKRAVASDQGRAGGCGRPSRPRRPRVRAPADVDLRDRHVDRALSRPVRTRRPGRATVGRPRVPEADRPPGRAWGAAPSPRRWRSSSPRTSPTAASPGRSSFAPTTGWSPRDRRCAASRDGEQIG